MKLWVWSSKNLSVIYSPNLQIAKKRAGKSLVKPEIIALEE
jgi:hypothetical protein